MGFNSLSYVNIFLYEPTRTVKVTGDAYDREGNLIAHLESQASCINPSERKLYYYWTGWHPSKEERSAVDFKGLSEYSFREANGRLTSGDGLFSDTSLKDSSSTTFKTIWLRRCDNKDEQLDTSR